LPEVAVTVRVHSFSRSREWVVNSYQAFFIPGIFVSLGTRAMMNFLGLPFRASVFVLDCFALIAVAFFNSLKSLEEIAFRVLNGPASISYQCCCKYLLIELKFTNRANNSSPSPTALPPRWLYSLQSFSQDSEEINRTGPFRRVLNLEHLHASPLCFCPCLLLAAMQITLRAGQALVS
jgi:hypothetical protein